MANYISRHARYRFGSAAFGAAGGLLCLGALTTGHGVTLLEVGMLCFSASMLLMSLSPRQEGSRNVAGETERPRDRQTVGISVRRLGISGRTVGPPEPCRTRSGKCVGERDGTDGEMELVTNENTGATRPPERKTLTWSI